MTNDQAPPATLTRGAYIICLSTPLIAEDVAAGVREWDATARIVTCRSADELSGLTSGAEAPQTLITSVTPAELETRGILCRVAGAGGRILWLATRAETAPTPPHGIVRLDVPFTTPGLHAALDRTGRDAGPRRDGTGS